MYTTLHSTFMLERSTILKLNLNSFYMYTELFIQEQIVHKIKTVVIKEYWFYELLEIWNESQTLLNALRNVFPIN